MTQVQKEEKKEAPAPINQSYEFLLYSERFTIFPKVKVPNGPPKSRPIRIIRNFILLTDKFGNEVEFKRYRHQGKWFWRDSRGGKRPKERDVAKELARMLYKGDLALAEELIARAKES